MKHEVAVIGHPGSVRTIYIYIYIMFPCFVFRLQFRLCVGAHSKIYILCFCFGAEACIVYFALAVFRH